MTPTETPSLGARFDAWVARASTSGLNWLWPIAYGAILGSCLWWLTHVQVIGAVGNNRMDDVYRRGALRWTLWGLSLLPMAYAAAHLVGRRLRGSWAGNALTQRLNLALLPCLALPPFVALYRPGIETTHPQMTLTFAALAGLCCALPVYRARGALLDWLTRRLANWAPLLSGLLLSLAWLAYGLFFSVLSIRNHHGLNTAIFDLALYDNIFYQSIHGTWLGCSYLANNYHGAAHFDPILVLLSPLYLIYPRAESLLVLQSFWMGAGVFPLYLLARARLLSRPIALLIASLWLVYPALHGANMYDFHSLSLVAPLIVALVYFLQIESRWGFWITLVAALLVREDVPLLTCFIGFAAILSRRPFGVRHGWTSIVASLIYFVVAKAFFMGAPEKVLEGTQTYTFAYYYQELIPNNRGITELFTSLLTNPAHTLKLVLTEKKVEFLLLVFLPLGFLPLLVRAWRFALIYGLVFCLLATREPVFSIYFQYVVLLFSVAFPLLPDGLLRLTEIGRQSFQLDPKRLLRATVVGLWVTSALVSFKFGGIVDNDAFRGGFSRPNRELDAEERSRYAWVDEMARGIPKEASVGSTRRLGPHVSNRSRAYQYPSSVPFDYLFLDETQLDRGAAKKHEEYLRAGAYETVGRRGKLVLYRRTQP